MPQKFIIGQRLKELRYAAGLTQEEFAERADMSYKFYQHIESGRKKLLRIDTIERICSAYNLPLWKFFHPQLPHIKASSLRGIRLNHTATQDIILAPFSHPLAKQSQNSKDNKRKSSIKNTHIR